MNSLVIHIRKEKLKFSAAHMTVFPDGTKEALHGHNYQVEFHGELKSAGFGSMLPFSEVKKALQTHCEALDERVLLPAKCPFLKKKTIKAGDCEFILCGKRYVLPADETVWLDVETISSESLAEVFLELFIEELGTKEIRKYFKWIEIKIEESPGQGASCFWRGNA